LTAKELRCVALSEVERERERKEVYSRQFKIFKEKKAEIQGEKIKTKKIEEEKLKKIAVD
jgi:hypothetical protein